LNNNLENEKKSARKIWWMDQTYY